MPKTLRLLILLFGLIAIQASAVEPLRVLFIGNSYTRGVRPEFEAMIKASKRAVETDYLIPGGYTLARHADNPKTTELIKSRPWDFVVFQEQSQVPSFPDAAERMIPPLKQLDAVVRERGAASMLFLTWGRKNGDRKNSPDDNYTAMQQRLEKGYQAAGQAVGAPVIPVGTIWAQFRDSFDLYRIDGSHPAKRGAYVAAVVFYRHLLGREALPSPYSGPFSKLEARKIFEAADPGP